MNLIYRVSLAIFCLLSVTVATAQDNKISIEKIWKQGTYSPEYVQGIVSMSDGIHYTRSVSEGSNQYIVKYAYESGNAVDTLIRSSDYEGVDGNEIQFSSYSFSPNEEKILIATDEESIYRRSSKANFYAIDLNSNEIRPITNFELGKQQLAAFSPTENQVAFVRKNDLFISNLDVRTETRVTDDGKWGEIINGAVDWVYEEEFGFARGFYWSPKGSKIAYYRFDESKVKNFDMLIYDNLYPTTYDFKYPKAGEDNSKVGIMVYDLKKSAKVEIDANAQADQYIPRIKWTQNDDELAIMRLNRHQNHLEFLLANVANPNKHITVKTIYDEKSDTYIEVNDNLIFLNDNKHFLWNSEKDGWNHIYMYDLKGTEVAQLTKGTWEVVEFYGADQNDNKLYFSAAIESPLEREVYSLDYQPVFKTYNKTKSTVVPAKDMRGELTKLTPNGHTNDASFSKSFDYFINFETAADMPYKIALFNSKGRKIRNLETNAALQKKIDQLDISKKEFGTFKTVSNIDLNYWIIKPKNFDPTKAYPAIFMIYGGPGRNTVTDSWDGSNYFWHQMLAQEGYIVISVDPRGTMYRGKDFKHSTYLELGKLETEDMIEAAKFFGNQKYIDQNRLGMMGWSYGGFMTSLAMTKGADYFKMGIAVAPVTNWRYYDSIYTERFMRTPQENAKGYDQNSPINFVNQLNGAYLLIHGSADDNVHYQNTMEMVKALVDADKQFDLFIYPNKNHGIYGGNTRFHLYTKMTNFIKDNL
ncbi:S9 family peptidase [Cryomorpha ignava]|uniref:S9 family peptidase n=1 Tax=Cryomorpha ignava TaxID=101383 RepID=UPI001EF7EFB0|nr:S9 family peptidase [Cryomorpha ignava]